MVSAGPYWEEDVLAGYTAPSMTHQENSRGCKSPLVLEIMATEERAVLTGGELDSGHSYGGTVLEHRTLATLKQMLLQKMR